MKKIIRYIVIMLAGVLSLSSFAQNKLDYVNPFIGTTNFGATNPGAIVPQGMVSVVPFNVTGSAENTWDKDKRWWSTPYSQDNDYFTGRLPRIRGDPGHANYRQSDGQSQRIRIENDERKRVSGLLP